MKLLPYTSDPKTQGNMLHLYPTQQASTRLGVCKYYFGPIGQNTTSAHRRRICVVCRRRCRRCCSASCCSATADIMTALPPLVPSRWEGDTIRRRDRRWDQGQHTNVWMGDGAFRSILKMMGARDNRHRCVSPIRQNATSSDRWSNFIDCHRHCQRRHRI